MVLSDSISERTEVEVIMCFFRNLETLYSSVSLEIYYFTHYALTLLDSANDLEYSLVFEAFPEDE
jgi:hypothetical protein